MNGAQMIGYEKNGDKNLRLGLTNYRIDAWYDLNVVSTLYVEVGVQMTAYLGARMIVLF